MKNTFLDLIKHYTCTVHGKFQIYHNKQSSSCQLEAFHMQILVHLHVNEVSPVTVLGKNPLTLVSSVLSTEVLGICSVAVVMSCGSIFSSRSQPVLLQIEVLLRFTVGHRFAGSQF